MDFKDIFIVLKRAFWDIIKRTIKEFCIKLNNKLLRNELLDYLIGQFLLLIKLN